jgi:hypothetical protein
MTYVAQDENTALAETMEPGDIGRRRTFAVATFSLTRPIEVLDLSTSPPVPSVFDSNAAPRRDACLFLQHFATEISRPIVHDDRVHIDYIPTQVVTEYFREAPALRKRGVRGLRFRSSRNPQGLSVVLFGGRELLDVSQAERKQLLKVERDQDGADDPFLKLVRRHTTKS